MAVWGLTHAEAQTLSGLTEAKFNAAVARAVGAVEIAKVPETGAKVCWTYREQISDGEPAMGFALISYDGDGGDARRSLVLLPRRNHAALAA